jgi:hypothetical protein
MIAEEEGRIRAVREAQDALSNETREGLSILFAVLVV